MTTKDQEREALKKIVKIMESLGSDSYVVTAFAGCVEIAEENITNDFGCSMKNRWQSAEKQAREAEKEVRDLKEKNRHLVHEVGALMSQISQANRKLDEKNDQIAGLHRIINAIEEEKAKLTDQLIDVSGYRAKAEREVMELKAKLYDLMTEGKQ